MLGFKCLWISESLGICDQSQLLESYIQALRSFARHMSYCTPKMENRMEKNMENEMETGLVY